jgi:outer membrane protein TolC
LRSENQGLKQRVAQLESTESDLGSARTRLSQVEGELQQSQQSRDEVRTRLERLIGVIEQASPAPGTAT